MSDYLVDGQRVSQDDAGFTTALVTAYARHDRPLCLCSSQRPEMYVAHLGAKFIVKRMPGTGSLHAPDCPSYEPPAEMSGLAQVIGTAITELPDTGTTLLKLDFALSRNGKRSGFAHRGEAIGVAKNVRGLTLRGLLHYLWDQAGLTLWQPGFAGRRPWSTVRRHLLAAAQGKIACGRSLPDFLYIPEAFSVAQRDEIAARRNAQWVHGTSSTTDRHPLMLLIGEVKEIVPARFGYVAVIKHVPDQSFALGEDLYRRMARHFEQELLLWGGSATLHMVMIASFTANGVGVPAIEELLLMLTNAQWIPVEDAFDLQLVDRLQQTGRRFTRTLRYDAYDGIALPTAVLLDTPNPPSPLHIERPGAMPPSSVSSNPEMPRIWVWDASRSPMPPLPGAHGAMSSRVQGVRQPV